MGCTDVPAGSAVIVIAIVLLVWVFGTAGYLEPAVVGSMLLLGLIVVSGACGISVRWRTSRIRAGWHCNRAQSTVSSDFTPSVLLESLITEERRSESD